MFRLPIPEARLVSLGLALLTGLALAGCSSRSGNEREIGHAYAGPAQMTLTAEISPKSRVVATLHHGERLGILGKRRRFVRVRTQSGVVGWTDTYKLLAAEQMDDLDELAETAKSLPSHGAATVYEALNVHTEPNRQSPSFYRVKEGEHVEVILYRTEPRGGFKPPDVLPRAPEPAGASKSREKPKVPPPPVPPAPKPPANWLELSKTVGPPQFETPAPPPKPVPTDEWALVRLPGGRAGWVLTGMLRMGIPDEVAQYSEGHRITSYFKMADVNDAGQIRHHWLWTTLSRPKQPYEFDSFRYFIWNVRHHRYETAYIERDVKGFFPVRVHPVQMTVGKKNETFPGFTLILQDPDGTRWQKTYAYQYYRVVLVGKQPYEPPADQPGPETPEASPQPQRPASDGWLAQIKTWKKKVLGR